MQDIIIEAEKPAKESGPLSLKMSRRNPVAAEVENKRMKMSGTSRAGKENIRSKGRKSDSRKVNKPDARRAETALIKPISAGAVLSTVRKPRSVPVVKISKTGSLFKIPEKIRIKMTKGMIKSEKKRRKFIEPT